LLEQHLVAQAGAGLDQISVIEKIGIFGIAMAAAGADQQAIGVIGIGDAQLAIEQHQGDGGRRQEGRALRQGGGRLGQDSQGRTRTLRRRERWTSIVARSRHVRHPPKPSVTSNNGLRLKLCPQKLINKISRSTQNCNRNGQEKGPDRSGPLHPAQN
jgi:hypothetical protein